VTGTAENCVLALTNSDRSPSETNLRALKSVIGKLYVLDISFDICHLLEINLLTYSMVQSPSWEANWLAAGQEIPRISRNPKVHCRTHKRPPPVSILGQPNPVHIPTSYLLDIHPNIIHPSTTRSPQWSLSLRLPHQDPILEINMKIISNTKLFNET